MTFYNKSISLDSYNRSIDLSSYNRSIDLVPYQLESGSYKNSNFTNNYNERTDRFGNSNFSSQLNNYLPSFFNYQNLTRVGNVNINSSGSLNISGNITFTQLRNCDTIDTDANGVLTCGSDAAGSGIGASAFNLGNYSAEYSSTGYKLSNFTSNYDARNDRWQLANFTTAFVNRLSELWNLGNSTRAYANEYAVSGYKKANLTIDYPNLDTNSNNDITTGDTGTVTNTMLAGSITISKLASGSSAQIIVANSGGVPTYVTMSGDATISNSGVLTIANDAVTASKIAPNAVGASEIGSGVVSSDEIEDNSITTTDLSANLTFSSTDLVDLGSVTHNDATIRGLRIPVSSGIPATLSGTPEGHIAWDSVNDVLFLSTNSGWATFFNNTANPNTWININNFTVGIVIGNGTPINRHLSATGTVGNGGGSISQNGCISDTITVTGAASGDTVVATPPSNIESNMLWSAYVSAVDTVTVTLCHFTSSSSSADLTWRIDVWKH